MIENLISTARKLGKELTIPTHTVLVAPGDKVDKIYWVVKGGLLLSHIHPKSGEEKALNFFTPRFHPLATVAQSFYMGEPSRFYLKSFTNTTLIELEQSRFDELFSNPLYSEWLQRFAFISLIEKNEIREMLIALDSREMFAFLTKKYPQLLQDVPSKYVANILNISPQWLSKLKREC